MCISIIHPLLEMESNKTRAQTPKPTVVRSVVPLHYAQAMRPQLTGNRQHLTYELVSTLGVVELIL